MGSECESQLCIEYTHEYRVICILNAANVTELDRLQITQAKQEECAGFRGLRGFCKMNYKLRRAVSVVKNYY